MKPRRVYDGVSEETARAAAALFDCELTQEPYRANGEPVWALNHRSESGNLRIVFWPSLSRLDVVCGPHMWVAHGITELEVVSALELIARFGEGGILTVARGGQVMMVGAGRPD